jgi:hypothetical protein
LKEHLENMEECRLALGVGRPKERWKDQEHLQGEDKEVSLDLDVNVP